MITDEDRQIQRGIIIAALSLGFFEAEAVAGEGSEEEVGLSVSSIWDMASRRMESFSSWSGIAVTRLGNKGKAARCARQRWFRLQDFGNGTYSDCTTRYKGGRKRGSKERAPRGRV